MQTERSKKRSPPETSKSFQRWSNKSSLHLRHGMPAEGAPKQTERSADTASFRRRHGRSLPTHRFFWQDRGILYPPKKKPRHSTGHQRQQQQTGVLAQPGLLPPEKLRTQLSKCPRVVFVFFLSSPAEIVACPFLAPISSLPIFLLPVFFPTAGALSSTRYV